MSGFRIRSVHGAGLSSREQDGNNVIDQTYALEPSINSKSKRGGQSNKDLAHTHKAGNNRSPMHKSESTGFAEKTYR